MRLCLNPAPLSLLPFANNATHKSHQRLPTSPFRETLQQFEKCMFMTAVTWQPTLYTARKNVGWGTIPATLACSCRPLHRTQVSYYLLLGSGANVKEYDKQGVESDPMVSIN